MQFCQSLNEQALELAEGPAEGIERILRQSRLHGVGVPQVAELDPLDADASFQDPAANVQDLVLTQDPTEPAEEPCGRSLQPAAEPFHDIEFIPPQIPPVRLDGRNDVAHTSGGYPSNQVDARYSAEFLLPQAHEFQDQDAAQRMPQPGHDHRAHRDQQVVQRNGDQGVLDIAQEIENRNLSRKLDTPRTKEACKRTGILPSELRVKALQEFNQVGDPPARTRMRFDHYENKRQEKLKIVLAERSKIMQEQLQKDMMGPAKGYHALQMMEELLDKEAKHQERELRAQVRYQNTVEKENEQQLSKEKNLRKKEMELQEKRQKAQAMYHQRALEARSLHEEKVMNHKELVLRNEQEMEMKQAGYLAEQLEDELRLRELQMERARQNNQKSEQWQQKMEIIQSRQEELNNERRAEGMAAISNYQMKLEQMDKRREEELVENMLKHEEKQLKLEDALEKKAQLSRQDEHRRQQVAMRLETNHQRVDTFLSMKEQIQQQRKHRAQMQAASKERAISLKSMMPGPADYYVQIGSLQEAPVPKISSARPKGVEGSIDEMVERHRKLPAPGAYDPKVLPCGQLQWEKAGPKMIPGKKKSYLDEKMRDAKLCPGPGSYDNSKSTLQLEHVAAIKRDYVQIPEGRPMNWAQAGDSCTPGPAAYALDPFHRQRRLRAQKSLPVISKAMNLG